MLPTIRSTRPRSLPSKGLVSALHTSTSRQAQGTPPDQKDEPLKASQTEAEDAKQPKKKTQAQLDQELMQKLAGMSGDGGDAGVEYEDGKPVSMKKSVKNNMFRYI